VPVPVPALSRLMHSLGHFKQNGYYPDRYRSRSRSRTEKKKRYLVIFFGIKHANSEVMFRLCLSFLICLLTQVCSAECVPLDLQSAWQRVLSYAPSIAAAEAAIDARRADQAQVSLLPNPLAVVEAENLGVSNHFDEEAEPPETTFALAQLIELGGKRAARRALASALIGIAYWDAQIERSDLLLKLTTAFIDVGAAQEHFRLAQGRVQIAEAMFYAIKSQVDMGKISPIQEKQAQIAWVCAKLVAREAFSELQQARKSLSSLWGSPPDFDSVVFKLFDCLPPPCCGSLVGWVRGSPDFAKAQAERFVAAQNLKLQKANSIPNLTLNFGYRVFNDSGLSGWLVGAQMPLPFFDRNQGNIQRALVEEVQAKYQMEEVVREMKEQIATTQEKMAAAFEESVMIRDVALAEAADVYNCVHVGYQNGKFEYLDLLQAQNTLFEIEGKYIESLHTYHLSKAELERLIGGEIE
jgi:outer membrane protein, heavy metal efflux system